MASFRKWLADDSAATSVEYAVMVSMILMAAFAAVAAMGGQTAVMYGDIQSEMELHGI